MQRSSFTYAFLVLLVMSCGSLKLSNKEPWSLGRNAMRSSRGADHEEKRLSLAIAPLQTQEKPVKPFCENETITNEPIFEFSGP